MEFASEHPMTSARTGSRLAPSSATTAYRGHRSRPPFERSRAVAGAVCGSRITDEAPLSPGSTRPRSTRKAHIPILIGGNGEKRTLRTCARFGDISNLDFWHPGGVDVFRHKLEILDRHCEDADRDPAEVKRTVCLPFRLVANDQEAANSPGRPWYCWGTASYIQDLLQQYVEAGA